MAGETGKIRNEKEREKFISSRRKKNENKARLLSRQLWSHGHHGLSLSSSFMAKGRGGGETECVDKMSVRKYKSV